VAELGELVEAGEVVPGGDGADGDERDGEEDQAADEAVTAQAVGLPDEEGGHEHHRHAGDDGAGQAQAGEDGPARLELFLAPTGARSCTRGAVLLLI
jgi:hypothetical protein